MGRLAVRAPGNMACGGVFETCRGFVLLCFHSKAGIEFRMKQKLVQLAIFALELARERWLDFIWLEADSSYVVSLLWTRSDLYRGGLKPIG